MFATHCQVSFQRWHLVAVHSWQSGHQKQTPNLTRTLCWDIGLSVKSLWTLWLKTDAPMTQGKARKRICLTLDQRGLIAYDNIFGVIHFACTFPNLARQALSLLLILSRESARLHIHTHTHTHARARALTQAHTHTHVCMDTRMYVTTCICMHTYINTYTQRLIHLQLRSRIPTNIF